VDHTETYLTWNLTDEGVGIVTLENKETTLNVFDSGFMSALDNLTDVLVNENNVNAVVFLSGKSEGFIAGANLDEIQQVTTADEATEKSRLGQLIFQKISHLPVPTIAAINGHCVGGGVEFVLACDYRLASEEKARFAFPEVQLGLIPGWGGTQRLPRTVSIQTALDMILTGKSYPAIHALKAGLVDKIVPGELLDTYAVQFAHKIIENGGKKFQRKKKKWQRKLSTLLLDKNRFGRAIIWRKARQNIQSRTGGHYPAPFKAIEVMKTGLKTSLEKGLEHEAKEFGRLMVTPEHKNLLHVYRLSQRPKNQSDKFEIARPKDISSVGVLGAGVMGGEIAQLFAFHDHSVRLKDLDGQKISDGIAHAESLFRKAEKKHLISAKEKEYKSGLISGTKDYSGFGRVDLVVEAVSENLEIKRTVLQEVEQHLSNQTVIASNTSALSISELQEAIAHPERVAGMHFFNPVHRMPLVEIISGKETSKEIISTLFQLALSLGKTPIVVQDSPGFLVNRILGVYLNEACLLAEEEYGIRRIDHLMKEFGMPMGPFRLIDEVGVGIAVEVARILEAQLGDYLELSSLLETVWGKDLEGKKSGKGFYIYKQGHPQGINPAVHDLVPGDKSKRRENVLDRLVNIMVNEAGRSLDEGIVDHPSDIDTGMIFGTGFPPFRGGLCRYADAVGFPEIIKTLKALEESCGKRFQPCDYLRKHESFYSEKEAEFAR